MPTWTNDFGARMNTANRLINACEAALGYKLTKGEMRDLIADNTEFASADISEMVETIHHTRSLFD
jgi:hypothetical protein